MYGPGQKALPFSITFKFLFMQSVKFLFFYLGMTWVLGSVVSLVSGQWNGFDRKVLKDSWKIQKRLINQSILKNFLVNLTIVFCHLLFLFPAIHPFFGFIVGVFFFSLV